MESRPIVSPESSEDAARALQQVVSPAAKSPVDLRPAVRVPMRAHAGACSGRLHLPEPRPLSPAARSNLRICDRRWSESASLVAKMPQAAISMGPLVRAARVFLRARRRMPSLCLGHANHQPQSGECASRLYRYRCRLSLWILPCFLMSPPFTISGLGALLALPIRMLTAGADAPGYPSHRQATSGTLGSRRGARAPKRRIRRSNEGKSIACCASQSACGGSG